MTVDIIIPVHNSKIYLIYTLEAILNNTKHPFKIILVESESTDGTAQICDLYTQKYPNKIEVYHTPKNGLITAINFGISKSKNDVFLTQDDVIVPKLFERDWLDILHTLAKDEKCGLVTVANGYGTSGPEYLDKLKWVGTWAMYIPRRTIDKIGYFDEAYNPGMGDDIDYSFRVYVAGFNIMVTDYTVEHHRKTEHFSENRELGTKHAEYFRKKWGFEK